MRRPARLLPLLVLCLIQIKILAACDECSSVNITASSSEIYIKNPQNFTISNITFTNGTLAKAGPLNDTVSELEPGVQYIVHFQNITEICCKSIITVPTAVTDILISNITTTAVTLTWKNKDQNAHNYSYRIAVDSNRTVIANETSVVISGLEPGTLYKFTIYPQINGIEGDGNTGSSYTKPSAVTGIQIENINSTTVNLRWNNTDPNSANYSYRIQFGIEGTENKVITRDTRISIGDLEPGTLYIFSIFPRINETEGDQKNASIYTMPTAVTDILISNITATAVTLTWKSKDQNAHNYSYRIVVDSNWTVIANETSAVISGLEPGTLYTFTIYPQINGTEGDGNSGSNYTMPTAVTDILFSNITATAVTLTWKSKDQNAHNYSYRIVVGSNWTVIANETSAVISGLEPGTLYTFTIYPQINGIEGDGNSGSNYTKPTAVTDILISNITTTAVTLTWKSKDQNAYNYSYRIVVDSNRTVIANETSAVISGLEPGTLYKFTIYPQINGIEGDGNMRSNYTIPSSVSNITATDISTIAVSLSWVNMDIASSSYSYRIHISRENGTSKDMTALNTSAAVSQLIPGTNYIFSIYSVAADNKTEGNPDSISLFTKPGAVSNITVNNISTSEVILSWSIEDESASGYTYRIDIKNVTSPNIIQSPSSKTASIQGLRPGTSYTFSIFAQVNSGKTEGGSSNLSVCTVAAQVVYLNCTPVPKQPELKLSWTPPDGNYNSLRIQISNGTLIRTESHTSEYPNATIKDLSYFVNYTVRIVTISCGEMSLPLEKTCITSITDPPVPSEIPLVEATSHSSLRVHFSPFDSINGPLRAYAVIITSSKEMKCTNEFLAYTYEDFIKKKTDSYVAYIKDVQHSSEVAHYDIEIGNGSISHNYFNGKLDPLGSYRACVAGFTHIIYNNNSFISSMESYVSFSDFSGSVDLPQNPDVITGAVVGCILAAILIAAIVGFMFWRKRRKDGKNNEVPFSAIVPKKSKLIKVENFESYFKKQKADSNCGFAEEYEDLRPVGVNQPKFAAELPENKGKNRYNNVLPYDISRVKLSVQSHPTDDYINANYMPGYNSKKEFIAAQGPLPNTVQDFWRMIWEKNIHTIVMLTKCIEQGRTKCEEYWPNKQSKNYGDITVAMTSEIILPEWTIRDFSMEKSDSSVSHHVQQFHFTAWPDHGVPETTDLLISFRHLVRDYMKQNPPTPTLVHCSAGVGRTGTFISIDRLIHQIEIENTVDVYGSVYDLRMHRPLMVQTEEQYVFLNQCVMDIIKSNKEKKVDLIYQNTNAMAIYENFRPSPHVGKANGYHVEL